MTKQQSGPLSITPAAAAADYLLAEWLATPSINTHQSGQLENLGVSRQAILRGGGLGWARVCATGRLYEPSATGGIAFIQPVWDGPAPSIYQLGDDTALIDLIAWRLDDPGRWLCREVTPTAALGQEYLDAAHFDNKPVVLFLTPLDWLKADCRGAVLLEQAEGFWTARREEQDADAATAWWGGEAA